MRYFVSLAIALLFAGSTAADTTIGKPTGYINDFANILPASTKNELEAQLRSFAEGGNPQIVVATIKTLDGDPIEDYANQLFREWGIGDKTKNNGVLFLIATNDRAMRIEVGYGLEGALTDIETKHIQDDRVRPKVRANDFDGGIRDGVTAIQEGLQGELAVPSQARRTGLNARDVESLFFFGLILLSWLGSVLGRSKSWWAGGVVGGVGGAIVWAFTQWLYWLPIAVVLGLLFDYFVSKNYREHASMNHPAWWAGGGWGGWDRWGGGGFGGFGGGSSGGGGSSSRW